MRLQRVVFSVLATLTLAVAFTLASPMKAEAAFIGLMCDTSTCGGTLGTNFFEVTDGSAGVNPDGAPANGVVSFTVCSSACTFTGTVGGLSVTSLTGTSKPNGGASAANPGMDLSWSATGSGTAWIYIVDTGWTGQGTITGSNGGTVGNNPATNITSILCGGTSNADFPLDLTHCTNVPGVAGPGGTFSATLSDGVTTTSPYSLIEGVKIIRAAGTAGTTSGDFSLEVTGVPEPATLSLLGLGLAGLASAGRKRLKANR